MSIGMRKSSYQAESGFSLIELLAALTILMIVIFSFGKIISSGYRMSQQHKYENIALAYAEQVMEQSKGMRPDTMYQAMTGRKTYQLESGVAALSEYEVLYNATTVATMDYATESEKNLIRQEVVVNWTYDGHSNHIMLVTFMTGKSK